MSRPKLKEQKKRVILAFRIDPELFARFEKQRAEYDRTKTEWGETAIQHYVEWCENHPLTSKALITNATQNPKL
jgi:predicted DNA-binding protein